MSEFTEASDRTNDRSQDRTQDIADGSTRLRVTLDVTPALRQRGGIGRYTRELARALLARGTHDYQLFVADRVLNSAAALETLGWPRGDGEERPDLRGAMLSARVLTILWHRLGLRVPVERWAGPSDIYHATDFLAPPTRDARSVITVHDLSFLVHPERAEPALARFLGARIASAVGRAAMVVADSQSTRRDLAARLGVADARLHVALPGVDPARFVVTEQDRTRVRARYGLTRPFVLGVGTLEPRKDWPTLVAAFEAAQLDGHELLLAGGRGWGMDGLDAALAATHAPVRALGFVPDDDLASLYHEADVFAYPSVYEGFGLPPLEAMACGTPTAVADSSSLPEVVGDAALRVPVGDIAAWADALRRLSRDNALRDALRRAGPLRAAGFTWDACAAAVEDAYAAAARAQ